MEVQPEALVAMVEADLEVPVAVFKGDVVEVVVSFMMCLCRTPRDK